MCYACTCVQVLVLFPLTLEYFYFLLRLWFNMLFGVYNIYLNNHLFAHIQIVRFYAMFVHLFAFYFVSQPVRPSVHLSVFFSVCLFVGCLFMSLHGMSILWVYLYLQTEWSDWLYFGWFDRLPCFSTLNS